MKLVKEDVKRKKKKGIKLTDSKATLMSWCIQTIECSILLKIYKWFTGNGYMVGQFCHDGLTIECNEHNYHPDFLPEDVIDEVNSAINEIGSKYNYENYTVTLSKKKMDIENLGNIIVDPNVLPPRGKKKVPAKLVNQKTDPITPKAITSKTLTFKSLSMHRLAIDGRSHIPYKITGHKEFKKMINDILDEDKDNFFLNEYQLLVDDVPHIYSLDFDWNLSDMAIYSIIDTLAECTKDGNCPSHFIARNEESGKVQIYVRIICKREAKICVLSKWCNLMWDNLDSLDKKEIGFSKEEWYSKIFDIKAPGLSSIYSVKKSGKGKKIKVDSLARYLPVDKNYECYNPLESKTGSTYRRRLIRWVWKYSINNTKDCREFDSEWYADALALSQKLNGPVGIKKFDVDRDLPNYFNEVEKVVMFAGVKFVVDEQFIETCLCALPDKFLVGNKWWWEMCTTKTASSIFDGGLPKCKDYFLHKFSKKVPAGMKAGNYNRKGNEVQ